MAVECCGAERPSPFCPQCGKALSQQSVLYGLLKKCRVNEKINETRAGNEFNGETVRDTASRLAPQWKAWGDALAALLEAHP